MTTDNKVEKNYVRDDLGVTQDPPLAVGSGWDRDRPRIREVVVMYTGFGERKETLLLGGSRKGDQRGGP